MDRVNDLGGAGDCIQGSEKNECWETRLRASNNRRNIACRFVPSCE